MFQTTNQTKVVRNTPSIEQTPSTQQPKIWTIQAVCSYEHGWDKKHDLKLPKHQSLQGL